MNGLWIIVLVALGDVERGEAVFRPTAAEAEVPERFRLPAARFGYELEPIRDDDGFTVAAVRFPSPVVSPDPVNNTVHAEFFCPKGTDPPHARRPAVIVLHILGADFALSRYLAARLAQRGVAALFVKLPYYGERRPPGEPRRFLSADIDRSVTAMRQGICDVRRAAAWLAGRRDVDPARLGITGVSLGGIVAAVAAAVDPTLNRAVLLLAGGDLARILWDMPEAEARRYRAAWVAAGKTFDDLKALTDPFDPLTHAHRLVGKRVLMIAGNSDEVIPPACTRALWSAAGSPPIVWYDCGHYSAIAYLLPATRRMIDVFTSELEPAPALVPAR
jgi:dienelactone hydrolase